MSLLRNDKIDGKTAKEKQAQYAKAKALLDARASDGKLSMSDMEAVAQEMAGGKKLNMDWTAAASRAGQMQGIDAKQKQLAALDKLYAKFGGYKNFLAVRAQAEKLYGMGLQKMYAQDMAQRQGELTEGLFSNLMPSYTPWDIALPVPYFTDYSNAPLKSLGKDIKGFAYTTLGGINNFSTGVLYGAVKVADKTLQFAESTLEQVGFAPREREFLLLGLPLLKGLKVAEGLKSLRYLPSYLKRARNIKRREKGLVGGVFRASKWDTGWQKSSLAKAIQKHAGDNYTSWVTKQKTIFENPSTGRQVVVDNEGSYFRIFQPKRIGSRKGDYLNLLGKELTVPVKTKTGIKILHLKSVDKGLWEQYTHFLIE